MPDLVLSSGALIDYAREINLSRVSVERYLAWQAAYSLAVIRETAIATATRMESKPLHVIINELKPMTASETPSMIAAAATPPPPDPDPKPSKRRGFGRAVGS